LKTKCEKCGKLFDSQKDEGILVTDNWGCSPKVRGTYRLCTEDFAKWEKIFFAHRFQSTSFSLEAGIKTHKCFMRFLKESVQFT
jgi:hypothetical protein